MLFDKPLQFINIFLLDDCFQFHHAEIAVHVEVAVPIKDISNAPGHACCKVTSGFAKNDYTATGHVFATVIADSFNDSMGATVPHAESFCCAASEEGFTTGCTVKYDITNDDVFFGSKATDFRWIDNDSSSGKPFSYIVIRITFEFDRNSFGEECSDALTGRAIELDVDRTIGQAIRTPLLGDVVAENGADGAVSIYDWKFDVYLRTVCQRWFG